MKFALIICTILYCSYSYAQDSIYMFSYFTKNGEDGLHLAYSEDALKWKEVAPNKSFLRPELSKDKLMRDPCIIRGADGKFHMVWTVSWTEKSIGYASSSDLITWSKQLEIPVMQHESNARNSWAPEITYDTKNKEYIIYWSTTITGLYPETQSTLENGYNHRLYYTKTKDFKAFSKTALLFEPGFNVIDASIVLINKRWYMFFKDETISPAQKNIKIATSKQIDRNYKTNNAPITGKYWAEGPTTVNVNGEWYVFFDKYTEGHYGAIKSKDLKQWKDISSLIDLPKGIRHGSIFKISKEEFAKLQTQQKSL